ncbi:MAG: InlB B-repeat-containing protein, partial [Clostridiales bacterium]|nr:InlB B-repeat-containing protein [Clostridiales bacterium]
MKGKNIIVIMLIACLLCLGLASCSGEKYTVNFETNGGEEIPAIMLDKKNIDSFSLPDTAPNKESSIFVGWYFDNDTFLMPATAKEIIEKFNSKLKDITIYAKWKEVSIEEGTYLINFETNGGNNIAPITISQNNASFTMPASPTREGYTFDNWYFDNGTFSQVATVNAIIAKLSPKSPYITIYAKWSELIEDNTNALSYLATSLEVFYNGLNKAPLAPSQSDIDSIIELTGKLQRFLKQGNSLNENYKQASFFFQSFNHSDWQKYNTYVRYRDLFGKIELTEEEENELNSIVANDENLDPSDRDGNYNYVQNWISNNQWLYQITQEELDDLNEYVKKAAISLQYDEYTKKKNAFYNNIKEFAAYLTTNDIRPIKINDIATFLASYDYSSLLMEVTVDQNTYMTLDWSRFTQFLIDMRSECGLTKEDVGVFYYKALIAYLNSQVKIIDEIIAEILDEINLVGQNPQNYPIDYQIQLNNKLDGEEKTKQSIISVKNELSQDYITETLDLVFGVAEIVNSNNIIEYFTTPQTKDAPQLQEIATLSASIKTACDQLIAKFNSGEYANSVKSLTEILTSLADNDSYLNPLANFVKALLPKDPSITLSKMSNVLSLITKNNLEIFLKREFNEEENIFILAPNSDHPYFMENISILESKIVSALITEPYSAQAISQAYDTLTRSISDFLPYATNYYRIKDYQGNNKLALKALSEMFFDKVKSRLIVADSDYNKVVEIANYNFISSENDIPNNLDVLPIAKEFYNLTAIVNLVLDIEQSYITIFSDSKLSQNLLPNAITSAAMFFALDIDIEKLSAYSHYMTELASEFPDRQVNSNNVLLAYAFDGLYKENCFDEDEIISMVQFFFEKGVEFVEQNQLLDIASLRETAPNELSFLLVNFLKLYSSLTIISNGNITTLKSLARSFSSATQTLNEFYDNSTPLMDNWTQSVDTLKAILDSLKDVDGLGIHAQFIDYVITSPLNGIKNLAEVVALLNEDTLYHFVKESEGKLDIKLGGEFFWDNLAILESKIITTLIDENNLDSLDSLSNLYERFIEYLNDDSNDLIAKIIGDMALQGKDLTIKAIIDLIYQNTQDDVVIDNARYNAIVLLSQKDYIVSSDFALSQQDFDTIIFANAFKKLVEYNDLTDQVLTVINDLYLTAWEKETGYKEHFSGKIFATMLATMYINNIEQAKIQNYLIYLNDALNEYEQVPFGKDNITVFYALMADGLIEANFSDQEILDIVNSLAAIVLAYLNDDGDIENNQIDIGKNAFGDATQTLIDIAWLFHEHNVLIFDQEQNYHMLDMQALIDIKD